MNTRLMWVSFGDLEPGDAFLCQDGWAEKVDMDTAMGYRHGDYLRLEPEDEIQVVL